MSAPRTARVFRFGVYEADAATGELYKHARRLRLPGQPFQILLMLLEANGDVVSREDIRQRLWPDGTFVDFDHSLNSAVNRLRETLADSATHPRYIETVAKRGYRFLVPVEAPAIAVADRGQSPQPTQEKTLLTAPHDLPQLERPERARTFFLLAQLMYFCFYVAALANLREIDDLFSELTPNAAPLFVTLVASACIGIASRLFLASAAWLRAPRFTAKYLKLFPLLVVLDCGWAFSPLLMVKHIGLGLALAASAALLLVPFGQRTLVLLQRTSFDTNPQISTS